MFFVRLLHFSLSVETSIASYFLDDFLFRPLNTDLGSRYKEPGTTCAALFSFFDLSNPYLASIPRAIRIGRQMVQR
jgi:hypothetical protein